MFLSALTAGILLGIDSLVMGFVLGTLPGSRNYRGRLALSFGLCDGIATGLGIIGFGACPWLLPRLEFLGPAAVAIYGAIVLGLAWTAGRTGTQRGCPGWLPMCLPICLSLDNLVAGGNPSLAGAEPATTALLVGAASGSMFFLGFELSNALARRMNVSTGWIGGCLLLVVAVAICF